MNHFQNMRIYVEVVTQRGFTAAADKLGLSLAQVSKSVKQLEQHLGTRLLNRTTRQVSLTEIGRYYYERSQGILADIDEVDAFASRRASEPGGNLSICAPTSFGIAHLNPILPAYLQQYPQIDISLSLSDRMVDVVAEAFDLVIRIAELHDSSLVARTVAPCKRVFCASPGYLELHGEPDTPQALARHHCLTYSNELKPDTWSFHGPQGIESIKVKGPMCADNGDALKDAALAGLGITLLPTFIVGPYLRDGQLQQVLVDYCPPEISIHAVYPSRRHLSAKVRTFIDFLIHHFGDKPDWDEYQHTR